MDRIRIIVFPHPKARLLRLPDSTIWNRFHYKVKDRVLNHLKLSSKT